MLVLLDLMLTTFEVRGTMALINAAYENAVCELTQTLTQAGLQAIRTFDLRSAREHNGICAHHGVAPCDCELTILMVYNNGSDCLTLTVHKCDGQVWLSLVHDPQQSEYSKLEATVTQLIAVSNLRVIY